MSQFFKAGNIEGMRPERLALLTELSDTLIAEVQPDPGTYQFGEELAHILPPVTDEALSDRLDILAALTQKYSGENLNTVIHNIYDCQLGDVYQDMVTYGLHGIHFRMNLTTQSANLDAVSTLSRSLYDLGGQAAYSDMSFPLGLVSAHVLTDYTREMQNILDEIQYQKDNDDDGNITEYTPEEIDVLLNLDVTCTQPGTHTQDWNRGLEKLIQKKQYLADKAQNHDVTPGQMACRVQDAFMAMVYNYSYRLKATLQISDIDLRDVVSPIIDGILEPYPASQPFKKALKRQVLINVFSAFPEGLKMFDTSAEEIQGVILDPVLRDDPGAYHFSKTLMGPIALFGGSFTMDMDKSGLAIVDFLGEAGYPINTETASRGLLFGTQEFLPLIHNERGDSKAIDRYLRELPLSTTAHSSIVSTMTTQPYLSNLSDEAGLNALVNMVRLGAVADDFLSDNSHFPLFFKARPHLVEPMLLLLEEAELANHRAFKVFGFGERELSLMKNPPEPLIEALLASDLGL